MDRTELPPADAARSSRRLERSRRRHAPAHCYFLAVFAGSFLAAADLSAIACVSLAEDRGAPGSPIESSTSTNAPYKAPIAPPSTGGHASALPPGTAAMSSVGFQSFPISA